MKFLANPLVLAGIIILGNFLVNWLLHLIFEEHPFFSDIRGHFYHVYVAAIGLGFLVFLVFKNLRSKSKK
ncbi:MAG: hypothetical protein AAB639_03085 [Patescibacteria group bacterium]